MSSHRLLIAAAVAGALLLPFAAAQAQPQGQQSSFGDASVPGVCMLSRNQVLAGSKVGQAADTRLKQIAQQVNNQLDAKRQPLQADIKKFQSTAQGMTDAAREAQQKALQQRMQDLRTEAQKMNARIQVTRANATKKIAQALDPLVTNVFKQRSCGILLDRDNVLGGNSKNDLTAAVITALNNKMSTITFNLAPLPKQSAK